MAADSQRVDDHAAGLDVVLVGADGAEQRAHVVDAPVYGALEASSAIGAFRRDVLVALGGVSGETLAEDTDLTLAIGQLGHRVVFAEDALAWTEAPSTLTGMWRQHYRWSFGTMQAVWKLLLLKARAIARAPITRRLSRFGAGTKCAPEAEKPHE